MTRTKKLVISGSALALFLGLGTAAVIAGAGDVQPSLLPSEEARSAQHLDVAKSSAQRERSTRVSGLTWDLVSYESSDGPCLDVIGTSESTAETGRLSTCGLEEGYSISIGGLVIDGRTLNIAFGFSPAGTDTAQVTSADGVVLTDGDARHGEWLFILEGSDLSDESADFASLTFRGRSGEILASRLLPSLSEMRSRAKQPPAQ